MLRLLNKLFSIDPRSLAAFRITAGVIVLGDLINRSADLTAFYTDAGVVPRSFIWRGGFPSLHMLGGSAEWEGFLFIIAGLAAVAMIVGWHARLATILSWYLLASLHARTPIVLISGDSLLRMMLFWGMFLPLGKVWSFDARRKGEHSLQPVFSVATIGILLQTCLLYWVSAYFKSNEVWFQGYALYHTFSFDAYTRPLGRYLLQFPTLLYYTCYATLALEGLGPFFAFIPWKLSFWRLLTIAAFWGLHIGIDLTLTVGLFSKVSLLVWVPFFPAIFWDKITGRKVGDASVSEVSQLSPLWPADLGGKVSALLSSIALVYILLACYASTVLPGTDSEIMKAINRSVSTTMMRQNWGVYAHPNRNDGWCVAAARLADGRTVDLVRSGTALDWEKPATISYIHRNHHWRTIFFEMALEGRKQYQPLVCRFLAGKWNATHPESEKILWVDLYWIDEWTPDPGEPIKLQQILLCHEPITAQGAFAEAVEDSRLPKSEQESANDLPPGL